MTLRCAPPKVGRILASPGRRSHELTHLAVCRQRHRLDRVLDGLRLSSKPAHPTRALEKAVAISSRETRSSGRDFYPLQLGTRWRYSYASRSTFEPVPGEPSPQGSTFQAIHLREVTCTARVGAHEYAVFRDSSIAQASWSDVPFTH